VLLDRIAQAAETSGLWEDLATDWMVLDCELMPWSAKAQELLISQYAPVGAAATHATKSLHDLLERMAPPAEPEARVAWEVLRTSATSRQEAAHLYVQAYRRYCWPVHSVDDYRIAPFHVMAVEGRVLVGEGHDHMWHMETLGRLADAGGPVLMRTAHKHVHLESAEERQAAVDWWLELTGRGGEGMVVKPRQFVVRGEKGLVQPAVKCRGPEYLRIIYGPEYLEPANLSRLRNRGLSHKRSMASREFALGLEGLTRFVAREPLRRVHECAFGVLAMESEPVDPRL
jgi:protein phosphatase